MSLTQMKGPNISFQLCDAIIACYDPTMYATVHGRGKSSQSNFLIKSVSYVAH